MTLTDFLLARIAEDEQAARASAYPSWLSWVEGRDGWAGDSGVFLRTQDGGQVDIYGWPGDAEQDHAARHDPARVLAECEAKRRIVELHAIRTEPDWVNPVDGPAYQTEEHFCEACDWVPDCCETVKAIAAIYADHPDFDPDWIA